MPKITYTGPELYQGMVEGRMVTLRPGQTRELPAATVERLLRQFPDRFERQVERPASEPAAGRRRARPSARETRS